MQQTKHTPFQSFAYHLIPGAFVVLTFTLLAPELKTWGYPPIAALSLAALIIIVPTQLGHLLLIGYKLNGRISLHGILPKPEPLTPQKKLTIIFISLLIIILIGGATLTFEMHFKEDLFSWLPPWYFYDSDITGYTKDALIATGILRLLVDGFILPVTEELYFRGYLYSRIPTSLGNPFIIGAVLFAVYHFWQPWNYISLLLISCVLIWPVAKYRSVNISLTIHLVANVLGALLFLGNVMQ